MQEVFGEQLKDAQVLEIQSLSSGVFRNGGNGKFSFKAFPAEMQVSPIFAFCIDDINEDRISDILSGGNLYGVIPYEGRYDGDWGDVLMGNKQGQWKWLSPVNSGWIMRGEVRDIKKLKTNQGLVFVVARNNEGLLFFTKKK